MRRYLLFCLICFCGFASLTTSGQPSSTIPVDEFKEDRLWSLIWEAMGVKMQGSVSRCAGGSYLQKVAEEHDLESQYLQDFLRLTTNFPEPYSLDKFLKRYPFINKEAHQEQWESFIEAGLMRKSGQGFFQTSTGKRLTRQSVQLRRDQMRKCISISIDTAELVQQIFKKVLNKAATTTHSFALRQRLSVSTADGLMESFGQLIAFRNDNAMGRFDWLGDKGVSLPPLHREIMESLSGQRTRQLDYYLDNPFWRLSEEAFKNALDDLVRKELIEVNERSIKATSSGVVYIEEAQALADASFYQPWQVVSREDYEFLKEAMRVWIVKFE
ncbi:MAG: hypothetical protein KDC99_17405 [Cyclobacteriaceae bacterium]|nr:hypothetical protein [Cyclobacteriaceae bacterium]